MENVIEQYEFRRVHPDGSEVVHRTRAADLDELLTDMMSFIRGCGFVVPAFSELVIVKDNEIVLDSEEGIEYDDGRRS